MNTTTTQPDILGAVLGAGITPYAIETSTGKRYYRLSRVVPFGGPDGDCPGTYAITYPYRGGPITVIINAAYIVSIETDARGEL